MTRDEAHRLLAEVKENHARLDACVAHRFSALEPGKLGSRYRCDVCGGEVDAHAAHWYRTGRLHGASSALDVVVDLVKEPR